MPAAMNEFLQANWPYLLIALIAAIIMIALLRASRRRTRVETDTSDVLDDGHGPAARNQALIDAPPAAATAAGADPTASQAAAKVEEPSAAPAPEPTKKDASGQDDLTRIKGLGPKIASILAEQGVTRFDQIAAWDEADIDRIDSQLGRFEGRIRRDNWVVQAQFLAKDDLDGYRAQFGNL